MINIVLFEPEIPENTGNIARSCVGFNANLHLIRPYGFILSNANLKRSGVDYWDKLNLFQYDNFDDFIQKNNNPNIFIFSRYGSKSPDQIDFKNEKDNNDNLYIMFGKESSGVDKEILKKYYKNLLRIPTSKNVRSLNLSNTVAIALYEISKQLNYEDLELNEPHKTNYIE